MRDHPSPDYFSGVVTSPSPQQVARRCLVPNTGLFLEG